MPLSGRGEPPPFISGVRSERVTSCSSKGSVLAYEVHEPDTQNDIWFLSMKGSRKPEAFRQMPSREVYPQLTEDNACIAYQTDESGRSEIYVSNFPQGDSQLKASIAGGVAPRWGNSEKELFYVEGNTLMSVEITRTENRLSVQPPVRLFDAGRIAVRLLGEYQEPAYAVDRNGERFVMVVQKGNSSVMMVQNWSEQSLRKTPAN